MRVLQDDSRAYAEEFASWGDWIDTIKERTDHCSKARRAAIKGKFSNDRAFWCDTDDRYHFTKTHSLDEALRIAIDGWPEGLDKARKLATPLFEKVSHLIERVEPVFDIEGGALDIGRYHDGDPEMFMRFDTVVAESAGNRVIRIAVNTGASGAVGTDTMTAKGATISSLVELLELAGNRVELTVIPFAGEQNDGGFKVWQRVIVKQADQPLDLRRVTYALAHPSACRRLGFAWMDVIPNDSAFDQLREHRGAPSEIEASDYDLYIASSLYPKVQWASPESAAAWILQSLKEQGVSLKEES